MVAENENADSRIDGDNAASSEPAAPAQPGEAPNQAVGAASSFQSSSQSPDNSSAPPPVEDRLKKGAKSYLMKVGKLMMMLAILGSLLIGFATYMISSTFNNIFTKLEHPNE
jgi:hypothetical protein